jgi:hypothetical protein
MGCHLRHLQQTALPAWPAPRFSSTPQTQAAFYETLLVFSSNQNVRFVISFLRRDYDALWEKIQGTTPEEFMAGRGCGLLDQDGKIRPAYPVWKRYFDLRLTR